MFSKIKSVAAAVACVLTASQAMAMPVNPEPRLITQPNGSTIAVRPMGDEKILWFETLDDGDILVKNPLTNYFEYADISYLPTGNELVSSGLIYGWAPTFSIPAFNYQDLMEAWKAAWENSDDGHSHAVQAADQAASGQGGSGSGGGAAGAPAPAQWVYDSLYIMVEFTDYQFNDSASVWSDKIFGGYPSSVLTGSVNDYYEELTQGGLYFTPASESQGTANDGFIKVQLPKVHPQLARNFSGWRSTLQEAFDAAKSHIDFSQYDADSNGSITKEELLISFIVAGRESSYNGSESEGFWGHAYFSNDFGTDDGVTVSPGYMGFGERQGPSGSDYNSTIGIIAHELGHSAFNLRDLYNSPTAISYWGLMGTGSWGYSSLDGDRLGDRPVHMMAMSKKTAYLKDNTYGIFDSTVVNPTTSAQQLSTAHPFGTADYEFFEIPGETGSEYWLVEQRKVEGYDRGLIRNDSMGFAPGDTGMLVSYRENSSRLWIRRMSGETVGTRKTDMLYGGHVTEFTPDSTYNSNYPDSGNFSGVSITNVSAPQDQMTFDLARVAEPAFPCAEFSDTVANHESAGRIYSVTEGQICYTFGCFGGTTNYYTTGANENLGSFFLPTYTTLDLAETDQDYFVSGSCPAGDFIAPVITLNGSANETIYQNQSWTDPGATASDNVDGNLTSSIVVSGDTVNTSVVGTYTVRYNVSDAAGNAATEVTREVNVVADWVPPTITLNGDSVMTIALGGTYSEPGYSATDNVDGDLTSSVVVGGDTVNTNAVGTYVITYNVSDTAGNAAAQVTRTVHVADQQDTTAPVITLVGSTSITITVGDSYSEPGYSATDNVDGNITANVVVGGDVVNPNAVGTYVVTYNVSDAAGNAAQQVTRTVTVEAQVDTTAPVITLTGSTSITITVGDSYSEPGYSATDNVDGDITANVVVGGDVVDPNTAGTYVVTYNVSDAAGNAAQQVTRTVTVEAQSGGACFNTTMQAHIDANRAKILYGSNIYTVVPAGQTHEYLGSTVINLGTVVALEETAPGHWVKVTSCN